MEILKLGTSISKLYLSTVLEYMYLVTSHLCVLRNCKPNIECSFSSISLLNSKNLSLRWEAAFESTINTFCHLSFQILRNICIISLFYAKSILCAISYITCAIILFKYSVIHLAFLIFHLVLHRPFAAVRLQNPKT